MQCQMDHIVLNIEDNEKMIGFYAEVLELETERLQDFRAGEVPFPSVRLNAHTVIDLFPKKLWNGRACQNDGRPHLNHFCFSLERPAWDALCGRLTAHGIDIKEGPVNRWGAHGTGVSIYFQDPEGNLIEARYYEKRDKTERCLLGS